MSLFRKKYTYTMPERLSPAEARERRLTALLEREQRFMQVPNFPEKIQAARSQAQKERVNTLAKAIVNEPQIRVQKAASIAAALNRFTERDFANPKARADYRKLRAAQEALRAAAQLSEKGRRLQNVPPSGGNKSYFNPTGKEFASTIYGTAARLGVRLNMFEDWVPVFKGINSVLPCIQRTSRREVMFAKGYAGRGYHTRKRRTWSSGVPC